MANIFADVLVNGMIYLLEIIIIVSSTCVNQTCANGKELMTEEKLTNDYELNDSMGCSSGSILALEINFSQCCVNAKMTTATIKQSLICRHDSYIKKQMCPVQVLVNATSRSVVYKVGPPVSPPFSEQRGSSHPCESSLTCISVDEIYAGYLCRIHEGCCEGALLRCVKNYPCLLSCDVISQPSTCNSCWRTFKKAKTTSETCPDHMTHRDELLSNLTITTGEPCTASGYRFILKNGAAIGILTILALVCSILILANILMVTLKKSLHQCRFPHRRHDADMNASDHGQEFVQLSTMTPPRQRERQPRSCSHPVTACQSPEIPGNVQAGYPGQPSSCGSSPHSEEGHPAHARSTLPRLLPLPNHMSISDKEDTPAKSGSAENLYYTLDDVADVASEAAPMATDTTRTASPCDAQYSVVSSRQSKGYQGKSNTVGVKSKDASLDAARSDSTDPSVAMATLTDDYDTLTRPLNEDPLGLLEGACDKSMMSDSKLGDFTDGDSENSQTNDRRHDANSELDKLFDASDYQLLDSKVLI